jgi:nitrite reductase (NADH) small subunit
VIDLESGVADLPDEGCTTSIPMKRSGDRLWLQLDVQLKVVHG